MQPLIDDTPDRSQYLWQNPLAYQLEFGSVLDTPEKALRYFESTELMDHASQNFYLRMQTSENAEYTHARYMADLDKALGHRYIISLPDSSPPLWTVHRRLRHADGRDEMTGAFVILGEMIWQASSVGDVVQARLVDATTVLSHSLARLSARLPPTSNRLPTMWVSRPAELPEGKEREGKAAAEEGAAKPTADAPEANADTPADGADTITARRGKRKRNLTAAGPNYALARAIASAERVRDECLAGMSTAAPPTQA